MPLEILLPLLLLALGFLAYCWYDLATASSTKHLPKWAWAIICAISIPMGGIIYLLVGRQDSHAHA